MTDFLQRSSFGCVPMSLTPHIISMSLFTPLIRSMTFCADREKKNGKTTSVHLRSIGLYSDRDAHRPFGPISKEHISRKEILHESKTKSRVRGRRRRE